jgi:hypothetical protein
VNNSFPRLIDGMCATLRAEVLPRLDDEFARGQVFGVINLLNTFKVRADWSATFLLEQLAAQQQAFDAVAALPGVPPLPDAACQPAPPHTPVAELLQRRDDGNRAIADLVHGGELPPEALVLLRKAMRAEVDLELKHAPRPLFAEMSSGREG